MSEHKHPDYKKIYFALVGLLVVSVAGPHLGIMWVTLITAFGVAVVKANLVIQNFMHLNVEKGIMKWMLATSVVLMLLFFAGVAPDVMRHEGTQWVNLAAKEATARGIQDPHAEEAEHAEDPDGDHAEAADEGEGQGEHPEEAGHDEGAGEGGAVPVASGFDAAAAFNTTCALCHGEAGDGGGPGGAALTPPPADFTDPAFWAERDDARIFRVIKEGAASVGRSPLMMGWQASYDDDQIHALVEYLKTFRPH